MFLADEGQVDPDAINDIYVLLGRMSPDKGIERAIEIARRSEVPLKIAAKIYPEDQDYFKSRIAPMLRDAGALAEFIGEVGGERKDIFLGRARALLFPIEWPEPFGLVMIEALACGTPVIAWPRGSVPEVISDARPDTSSITSQTPSKRSVAPGSWIVGRAGKRSSGASMPPA